MPEEIRFAKHLPPSAGLPRVLALEARTAAALASAAEVMLDGEDAVRAPGSYDAIAGLAAPEVLPQLVPLLRPGGRAILATAAEAEALLAALERAGLIHCLVEEAGPVRLYRGERPPAGSPVERVRAAAGPAGGLSLATPADLSTPYVFLLVTQTPNKPAWKLAPDERVGWQAATIRLPYGGGTALLVFSSLLKAVGFMQAAILAGWIAGVNKVGKFPAAAAPAWPLPLVLNVAFEAVSGLEAGAPLAVDPHAAITGEE